VTELNTSLQVVTENDRVIRKIWKVSCKGTPISGAYSYAQSFKPAEKNIHGELEKFFQESRVAGGWIWDIRRTADIVDIDEEPIQYTRSGKDYVVSTQVGKPGERTPLPIVHELAGDAVIATVRGEVIGYSDRLDAPPAHWIESNTLIRWEAAEVGFERKIVFRDGLYRLPYIEIWIGLNGFPAPNHSNHKDMTGATPPGDGRMAG
jgi:hypothetical protein